MDISTILGFVLGLGLIVWSMMHGGGMAGLVLFVHPPAFAVVFGGSLAAVMIHFRIEDVKLLAKVMLRTFLYPIPSPTKEIDRIIEYTNLARKEGLLALESKLEVSCSTAIVFASVQYGVNPCLLALWSPESKA